MRIFVPEFLSANLFFRQFMKLMKMKSFKYETMEIVWKVQNCVICPIYKKKS